MSPFGLGITWLACNALLFGLFFGAALGVI
jgi:hypothetical protein